MDLDESEAKLYELRERYAKALARADALDPNSSTARELDEIATQVDELEWPEFERLIASKWPDVTKAQTLLVEIDEIVREIRERTETG